MEWTGSIKGRVLVATPLLIDPNFYRTVVLMLQHTEDGAIGLVINRPSEMPVAEPLPSWRDRAAEPAVVFFGGPCDKTSAICIGTSIVDEAADGWAPLFDSAGTVDLNMTPDELSHVERVRVFAGYAGWGPGQLERELEEKSWVVCRWELGDVLCDEPEELWPKVLEREGGEIAWLTRYPDSPILN